MAGRYSYIRGNQPTVTIVLTGTGSVSFNGGPEHGSYHVVEAADTLQIKFHSQAEEGRSHWHIFERVTNTTSYRLINVGASDWSVVMVRQVFNVEHEPTQARA